MAPRFAVREGYALHRGPVTDGGAHRHAAFQIAIAPRGEVVTRDASGDLHRAEAPARLQPRTGMTGISSVSPGAAIIGFAARYLAWS